MGNDFLQALVQMNLVYADAFENSKARENLSCFAKTMANENQQKLYQSKHTPLSQRLAFSSYVIPSLTLMVVI